MEIQTILIGAHSLTCAVCVDLVKGLVSFLEGKGSLVYPTMDRCVTGNGNSVSWKQNMLPEPFISFQGPHIVPERRTFITVQQGGFRT